MELQYYKDAKHNYLIMKAEIDDENLFQYRMLENNAIEGLLPFSLRNMDGCFNLYYEMDSKQSIKNKYIKRKMSYDRLIAFFRAYIQAAKNLEDYLLDSCHIVLSPETIFEEFNGDGFFFIYDPVYERNMDQSFLEELMEYIDLENEKGQELIFSLLDSICDDNGIDFNLLGNLITVKNDTQNSMEIVAGGNGDSYDHEYNDDDEDDENSSDEINEKKIRIRLPFEGTFIMAILFAVVAGALVYLRYAYILTYEENLLDMAVFMLSLLMSLTCFLLQIRKNHRYFRINRQTKERRNEIVDEPEHSEQKNSSHSEVIENRQASEYDEENEETVLLNLDFGMQCHKLYAVEGNDMENISLGKLPMVIGKLSSCSDAVIKDKSVSRMHARIYKPETGSASIWIQDLNSTNGTFINGRRLMPNEKAELSEDDEISFGKCAFAFR